MHSLSSTDFFMSVIDTVHLDDPQMLSFSSHKVQWQKKFLQIWLAFIYVKVHIFWEGHKILQNLHCKFDRYYIRQIYGGDFAKLRGLLRIYELYQYLCSLICYLFKENNPALSSTIKTNQKSFSISFMKGKIFKKWFCSTVEFDFI
mgnify:CR=1 FL=1